jgi:hypothetical protein
MLLLSLQRYTLPLPPSPVPLYVPDSEVAGGWFFAAVAGDGGGDGAGTAEGAAACPDGDVGVDADVYGPCLLRPASTGSDCGGFGCSFRRAVHRLLHGVKEADCVPWVVQKRRPQAGFAPRQRPRAHQTSREWANIAQKDELRPVVDAAKQNWQTNCASITAFRTPLGAGPAIRYAADGQDRTPGLSSDR